MSARRRQGPAPRVALFDAYPYQRGGTHVGAEEGARVGRETGRWDTTLVVPDDGVTADWFRERGTPVLVVPFRAALLRYAKSWRRHLLSALLALPIAWWRLSRAFKDFDIVHSHDVRGLMLAGPAALLARRRLVVHIYDSNLTGRIWPVIARGPLRWSRLPVVVPSRRAASIWAGGWSAKLVELPNSVEIYGRAPEPPESTIVTLARIHPHKGLSYVVDAVDMLAERGIDTHLLIAGSVSPGYEALGEELAAQAARSGRATLLGDVDDPHAVLRRAWVYAQPSEYDNLPLAMLEAAASGLPIVATQVGGLADIVEDGVTGYLVPSRNPAALADALQELLTSAELREKFGLAGVERIKERFSRERYTTVLGELYRA